jgi:uncharacterized protein (UPF0297 family)
MSNSIQTLETQLVAAQQRMAELESHEAEHQRTAQIQTALYRIAEAASAAEDMREFYAAIHQIVGELMYAKNFYIALYDHARQMINFPYYVDEVDEDIPDPNLSPMPSAPDSHGCSQRPITKSWPDKVK